MSTDWMGDAACRGDETDSFHGADDFTHPELTQRERKLVTEERRIRARIICSTCPVATQCLQYGSTERGGASHPFGHGTYAGRTTGDRHKHWRNPLPPVVAIRQTEYVEPAIRMAVASFVAGATMSEAAAMHDVPEAPLRAYARRLTGDRAVSALPTAG